jgi:hypothetical protein
LFNSTLANRKKKDNFYQYSPSHTTAQEVVLLSAGVGIPPSSPVGLPPLGFQPAAINNF